MIAPLGLRRRYEQRLRDEARRRVAHELARLNVLQRELAGAQEDCRRAIAEAERRRLAVERLGDLDEVVGDRSPPAMPEPQRPRRPERSARPPEPERPEQSRRPPLRTATYADLRTLGLSVSQAHRVLDQRRAGGIATLADLVRVSWLPREVRAELAHRLGE